MSGPHQTIKVSDRDHIGGQLQTLLRSICAHLLPSFYVQYILLSQGLSYDIKAGKKVGSNRAEPCLKLTSYENFVHSDVFGIWKWFTVLCVQKVEWILHSNMVPQKYFTLWCGPYQKPLKSDVDQTFFYSLIWSEPTQVLEKTGYAIDNKEKCLIQSVY